jgi:hypothetical protein
MNKLVHQNASVIEQHQEETKDPARQKAAGLVNLERQLLASKLGKGQTPESRAIQLTQKQGRLELAAVRDSVAIAGTLASIAREIGFEACPLDTPALRGAMLTILEKARDAVAVAEYRQRDAAFCANKRRQIEGIRTFVAAPKPSAELAKAARALKLRHDALAGGFSGRAGLDALLVLGRDYNCTVRIQVEGEHVALVERGIVDETVLGLVAASGPLEAPNAGGDGAVPDDAGSSRANSGFARPFMRPAFLAAPGPASDGGTESH